jgi:quercetin dioxygenase-like cupin family protein
MGGRGSLIGLVLVVGCLQRPAPHLAIGALRHGLEVFVDAHPLASQQDIRVDLLERTAGASLHLVQLRGAERPHRHLHHDLVVQVVRGQGTLTVGGEAAVLRAGDAVVIARGTPHWFVAESGATAVAVVTFAPPLDEPDSVPVDVDSSDGRR